MVDKSSGSNAARAEKSSPKISAENGKIISASSDGDKIKIRFTVDSKPEYEIADKGAAAPANAGTLGTTSTNHDAAMSGDSSAVSGGFSSAKDEKDSADIASDSSKSSLNDNAGRKSSFNSDDNAAADDTAGAGIGDAEGAEDAQGDQNAADDRDNQEDQENQDDQNAEEGDENVAGDKKEDEENQDNKEGKDGEEGKEGENGEGKEGEGKEGEGKEDEEGQDANDPALNASAATTAALGGAEMADEAADNLPEQEAAPEQGDLGDSGTAAAAGTNPALNQETADQPRGAADQNRESAKNDLLNSEKKASADSPQKSGDKEAKNKEENPDSGFKNSAVGKANNLKSKIDPRYKLLNKLKQFGPMGIIMAFILGVGFMLTGLQSFLPFTISELLRTNNDSLSVPTVSRAKRIFVKQLAQKAPDDVADANNFNVSNKQRSTLSKNGLYVVNSELTGEQMMLYDDGSGTLRVVAADETSAASLKGKIVDTEDTSAALLQRKISTAELNEQLKTRYGKTGLVIDTQNVETLDAKLEKDTDFSQKFTKGSKTWGSSVAEWFDIRTAQFLNRNFITRNLFKKYINRTLGTDTDADADGVTTAKTRNLEDVISDAESARRSSKSGSGVEIEEATFKEDGTQDPNQKKAIHDADFGANEDEGLTGKKTAAVNKAKSSLGSIAKAAATKTLSGTCMILNFFGAASLIAAGYNIAQILPIASAFFEATDKAKYSRVDTGNSNTDGDVPLEETAKALTDPSSATLQAATGEWPDNPDKLDQISESNLTTVERPERTALQSEAMSATLAGAMIDPTDPIVSSLNVGNMSTVVAEGSSIKDRLLTIAGEASIGVGAFKACSLFKLGTNAISATMDFAGIVGGIIGFCAGGPAGAAAGVVVGKLIKDGIKKVGTAVIAAGVVSLMSQILVPRLTTIFLRSLPELLKGEHYGAALVAGAAIYMGRNHLFGGGSPGTRAQYVTAAVKQKEQLAKDAEYERANRSPFDITSQYTFAGSMLRQFAILSSTTTAPTNILSTIGTLTKNSVVALMPSAAADTNEIASNMMTEADFEANCPYLSSIDAYGDAFCNPYIISDFSTMDTDPEDVESTVRSLGGLSESGEIYSKSELANYIDYCAGRTSNFGIVDGNIANSISSTGSTGNTYADATVGVIPVYGDILDIVTEKKKLSNIAWITGEKCVASYDSDSDWGAEIRYYQRYVEDERLKESIYGSTTNGGTGYVSPVTAYIEKRNEENPIDNSMEGVLARYSGLTKDQVVATLDYMEYLNYIAKYDSSERYAFGDDFHQMSPDVYFEFEDNDTIFATNFMPEVVYADIRNRFATTA